jgi:general secretion pathway protein I
VRIAPALKQQRAFTLIEVIVALFIVALGLGALLTTLTSSASNVEHLRDKSFAEWVALNRISTVRLARPFPTTGKANGQEDFANTKWYWRQEVAETATPAMHRIEVSVARTESEDAPALATAVGFIPLDSSDPSGYDPDWSVDAAPAPTGGGGQKTPPPASAPAPAPAKQP